MKDPNDIEIHRGDSYPLPFDITDDSDEVAGPVPIPLDGWTLRMTVTTIKDPPDDTYKVFDMVGVMVPALIGRAEFTPTVQDTAVIGNHFYDVQITKGSEVRTVRKAKFDIVQDNTK